MTVASSVQNNQLSGMRGGQAIEIDRCDIYQPQRALVANNFVQIGEGTEDATGLRINYGDRFDVVFNTINITSVNQNNEAFYHYQTNDVIVLNNNFSTHSGYAYYSSTTSDITESNHNNIFSNTDLAYWDGAISDLISLQAASGLDSNSISENPYFPTDTNYQVVQVSLNNAGTPFAGIAYDIEGEPRDATTPDIGADEFIPTGTDAGLIAVTTPAKPFSPGFTL
ncbi:MAG: hypothetical protein U5L96_21415 [Owenweeksia sp.]|nr:hypothetical protein [Owenweeksia sp.]